MKIRLDLFAKEAVLFFFTLAIGIYSAYRYSLETAVKTERQLHFSPGDILFSIIFLSLFFIIFTRFKKAAKYSFRIFLILLIFFGAQAVLGVVFGPPLDNLLSLAILLLYLFMPNILVQDIAVAFAIGGISSVFGISIMPGIAAVLLVALSVYDIVAVYKTKHMIALAKEMVSSGAIFGFIIPADWKDFFFSRHEAHVGERFMILGSGDVGLPLILSASVATTSLSDAVVVALFSIAGLFVTHLLFVTQEGKRRPMAALPPIATMTVIGYLVTILF
ncbi:MAG: hypothetical protein A2750_00015 [Candidatus Yanofskybacteria bacterium RIFCSPHIGHO2_01_FULL_45_42]|uniref:Uncharacterized protein n=2 Tax=Candidatus Yanofskyibacteriota TaxID=1752733 RepID=A0A1F8H4R8_9BACT|nr:MAG: hypothetical protein A2750_00015 [Candidatus Yanofskybacteria bacterium RIFCSPHIGHO2_01_FULL_45_42]OGN32595.1 MAG: hypothetical protein A3J01_01025 [Candidatus Yanofskybacteria bacterium RIFCSPLOWO2_02_FULL_45_18]